jgi:hypothetical protein
VWSEDEPNIAIDWSDMSRSPSPSPPGSGGELIAAARAGRSREWCRLELAVGGPPHQRRSESDPFSGGAWRPACLRGAEGSSTPG